MPSTRAYRASRAAAVFVALALLTCLLHAQPPTSVPPNGLRDNTPTTHALVHARIVTSPGQVIDRGTLVTKNGVIVAVGADDRTPPPPDARVWDCTGKTIYTGLIDAFSELPADAKTDVAQSDSAGARYWNPNVTPQLRADRIYKSDPELNKKLRSQGIVARLVAPSVGMLKGTSALVTTDDDAGTKTILVEQVAQHASLTIARQRRGEGDDARPYPTSPMGAFTLVRQALYDAQWYAKAWAAHRDDPSVPRPEQNDALAALDASLRAKQPIIIDTSDELYFFRADAVAREFDLNLIVRGSGQEYRRLSEIAATKRPVIVPVNFPKPPDVSSPEGALNATLEDLMDWDLSPENPGRLDKAGVSIALSTHGLKDKATFLTNVRKAVVRGLSNDAGLKAATVTPANLLGAGKTLGSLEPGKAASFVITDGDLFAEKTKVLETWIDGKRFEVAPQPLTSDPRGRWTMKLGDRSFVVTITGEIDKLSGKLAREATATRPATTQSSASTKPSDVELQNVKLAAARIAFTFKGESLSLPGVVQVSANLIDDNPESWLGSAQLADGSTQAVTAMRTASAREVMASQPSTQPTDGATSEVERDAAPPTEMSGGTTRTVTPTPGEAGPSGPGDRGRSRTPSTKPVIKNALFAVNYPLGDFGRDKLPDQPRAILFANATVWTSGPEGKIENANVVVEGGKITRIFRSMEAVGPPGDAIIVDCAGKQISPGIIDCHSHIATDGGVNESGQAITAEVRIGDFINPDDINIYRQLAGGVTSSNILHGSANPIGGQNQVIKLRWGATPEQLKFENAPPGIKFALGENVKQSNWDIPDSKRTRYPQTRMGVEQIVRDEFKAARDYERSFNEYASNPKGKVPPRKDLELDTIVEILNHQRWIHCHSYRQDEILALIRTLDDFNVQIGSFQHILEGYKVADAMKKHGATASSFADWWAYKIEVYDAIPYNGAIMHDVGLVVSFNSDDAELARRLNLEAAKAVKYGGVSEVEALKFVTLNPAKQLRIDARVGSIEVGKDADLVVWRGSPLSTLSRVEQTWIDGRKFFDREEDAATRKKMSEMRTAIVQRILASGEPFAGADEREDKTKTMFPDEDIYCGHSAHGH